MRRNQKGLGGASPRNQRPVIDSPRKRLMVSAVVLTFLLTIPLTACSLSTSHATKTTATTTAVVVTTATATSSSTAEPPPTPSPTASSVPTSAATPTNSPTALIASPTAVSTPTSDVTAVIQKLIEQGNHEEEQAIASNDPTVMQDTSTANYYSQLVQNVQTLLSDGVTSIHLVHLDWGEITQQNATTIQATTTETWDAVLADSTTQQQTDLNVYTLVLENNVWKIDADQHPNTQPLQTPGSASGAATPGASPATTTSPSENWAGYSATGGTFTSVSASWTVPRVGTTTDPAADATWVGIGGVQSTDLIQAGTDAIVESGQVTYAAWIETLPRAAQNVPLSVTGGDKVTASITQQSSGEWQITIKNLTSGKSYQNTVQYNSTLSSAEWIEESPSAGRRNLLPIDDFGSVSFSNCVTRVDGNQRTIAQVHGEPISMEVASGQELAQTSILGSDGQSFTVTRTNIPAPSVSPRRNQFPSG